MFTYTELNSFTMYVCTVFFCLIAEWSIPVVTGDTPPPASDFTFTKISVDQGVVFGGYGPTGFSSALRLATVHRGSVVSVKYDSSHLLIGVGSS